MAAMVPEKPAPIIATTRAAPPPAALMRRSGMVCGSGGMSVVMSHLHGGMPRAPTHSWDSVGMTGYDGWRQACPECNNALDIMRPSLDGNCHGDVWPSAAVPPRKTGWHDNFNLRLPLSPPRRPPS